MRTTTTLSSIKDIYLNYVLTFKSWFSWETDRVTDQGFIPFAAGGKDPSHLMTWIQTHFDRVQLCNNSNSSLHYILHMTSAQALEMSGSHRQLQSLLQGYTLVLSIFPT